MAVINIDPAAWAQEQFGACQLGDLRRTNRLVKIATQAAARPDGSTPDQTETWAECKAVYRLMDCDDVTHAEIIRPHCEITKQSCAAGSVQLILCDTTDIDYQRSVAGLGSVGPGKGWGFFLHTGLMRDANSGVISGIAGQELFYRKPKRKKKVAKNSKRRDPNRESIVWGKLIDQIGSPPADVRWLHVCDRGADDYEVYCRAFLKGCGWVIRATHMNRIVQTIEGEKMNLKQLLQSQPDVHQQTVEVPRQGNRQARTAEVTIRFAPLRMPPPRRGNDWIKENAPAEPLLMWVVELKEENPPQGAEALHWVLLTSEPITNVEDALQVVDFYGKRWGVEEYHKVLKTGCRVEKRYYETAERLERVTGMLAVLAIRLLQIRTISEEEPDRPAVEIVPRKWVKVLSKVRKRASEEMTIHEFVRHIGGLGGHLGRKSDGHPGWITLWRGLEKLLLILRGTALQKEKCG